MTKKPTLIILVGNIGGGKSTLAKKYAKKGYIIVSRDALRYSIGAGNYIFDITCEPSIKQTALKMCELFMLTNKNILIDEVNVSKKLRQPYLELAKKHKYRATATLLPRLSKKASVDRRLQDPHGTCSRETWNSVWTTFNRIYQEPTKKEGFNKIIKL